ncbi:MAG: hypothetical protein WC279_12560 [Sulfurimonas sp.]|jgi:hypothetical protein|uniref:hypothetical protein n=1 Tax=Sulfurimonas sp. TaxID=2022749 RepID=UPI00356B5CBF
MSAQRKEPVPQTCPVIDSTLRELDSCYTLVSGVLEDLRKSNSALRDWGNELLEELEAAEKELDIALGEKRELEQEVERLNRIIEYEMEDNSGRQ